MPTVMKQNRSGATLSSPATEVRRPVRQLHRVVLIPGDGIGPEVAEATVRVVEATGISVEWEWVELNAHTITESGGVLPKTILDALGRIRVALKGPVGTPIGGGFQSVNLALRKKLNLFANFRPVRSIPGLTTRYSDVLIDLVIFGENTESLYSGLEHRVAPGVVESLKIITRRASLRIARSAFAFARREGRRRVTAIHKANILKLSDGLFLRCGRRVAREYPEKRSTTIRGLQELATESTSRHRRGIRLAASIAVFKILNHGQVDKPLGLMNIPSWHSSC